MGHGPHFLPTKRSQASPNQGQVPRAQVLPTAKGRGVGICLQFDVELQHAGNQKNCACCQIFTPKGSPPHS